MKMIKKPIPTFKQHVDSLVFEPSSSGEVFSLPKNSVVGVKSTQYPCVVYIAGASSTYQDSVTVYDLSGNCATNNITVRSLVQIDGAVFDGVNSEWNYTINTNYKSVVFIFSDSKWTIAGTSNAAGLPTTEGYVYVESDGTPRTIANALSTEALVGFDSDGYADAIDIGDGLDILPISNTPTIKAKTGSGLQINPSSKAIEVDAGDGITVDGYGVSLNLGNGLEFDSGAVTLSPATGDVSGTYPNLSVNAIQGTTLNISSPIDGQTLIWDNANSQWINASVSGGGGGGGGGGGFAYYLNYSTAATTPPTGTWKEMSTNPSNHPTEGKVTISTLSTTPVTLMKFESPVSNPSTTIIPGGTWSLNTYLATNATTNEAFFSFKVYKITGTTPTEIAASSNFNLDQTATTLYTATVEVPATTILTTDRVGIEILVGRNNAGGGPYYLDGYFEGSSTIGYVGTTFSAPGGTGIMKVVTGIIQSPATQIVDGDVSATANITGSKIKPATNTQFGVIHFNSTTGDLVRSTSDGYAQVNKIQGRTVDSALPVTGDVLNYSAGGQWQHTPLTNANIDAAASIDGTKIKKATNAQFGVVHFSSTTGDLSYSGTDGYAKVNKIQGITVDTAVPSTGEVLNYNGTQWTHALIGNTNIDASAAISGDKINKATDSQFGVIKFGTATGDLIRAGTDGFAKVNKIQGVQVSTTAPSTAGHFLRYNNVDAKWEAKSYEPNFFTLIYDPEYSSTTYNSVGGYYPNGRVYNNWTNLVNDIPYSGLVLGRGLIVIRGDVTLTSNLDLDGRVSIKGEQVKTSEDYPILYTSTWQINNPIEFENINIVNNHSSPSTARYCLDFDYSGTSSTVFKNRLILRNTTFSTSNAANTNLRFILVRNNILNIELYGKSSIGGGNYIFNMDNNLAEENQNQENPYLKFDLSSSFKNLITFSGSYTNGEAYIDLYDSSSVGFDSIYTEGSTLFTDQRGKIIIRSYTSSGSREPMTLDLMLNSSAGSFQSAIYANYGLSSVTADLLEIEDASWAANTNVIMGGNDVQSMLEMIVNNVSGYPLTASCDAFNPVNGSFNYFGFNYALTPSGSSSSARAMIVPQNGRIEYISFNWGKSGGTVNSGGFVKIYVAVNGTSSPVLISISSADFTSNGGNRGYTLATPISVSKGNDLEVIAYFDSMSASPVTNLRMSANVYIKTIY